MISVLESQWAFSVSNYYMISVLESQWAFSVSKPDVVPTTSVLEHLFDISTLISDI